MESLAQQEDEEERIHVPHVQKAGMAAADALLRLVGSESSGWHCFSNGIFAF
jgi:hypothetical protein